MKTPLLVFCQKIFFSNRKYFSSYKKLEGNYKINIKERSTQYKIKTKKGGSVTVVDGDSIVKIVKSWELSIKDDLFVVSFFLGAKDEIIH